MVIPNEFKKIAVVPVYNEERGITDVLADLVNIVDILIIVNDGSTDRSAMIIRNWQRKRENIYLIDSKKNRGMSWAVKRGFSFIYDNKDKLGIQDDDVVIQIDADAQHLTNNINEMINYMKKNEIDYFVTCRVLRGYPFIKVMGNRLMSKLVSIVTSRYFNDVESGFRLLKAKVIPQLLFYTFGFRYSWAQEMIVIASKIGLKVDNTWEIPIAYYRNRGTQIYDAFVNSFFSCILLQVRFGFRDIIKDKNYYRNF